MQRTTKQERKCNAKLFWQYLQTSCNQKAAIVIESQNSKTNPNICRVQFRTVRVNSLEHDVVIAESVDGVAGCFHELIKNIHGNIEQKNYFEVEFNDWLRNICHMEITWYDGLVMMLEYWYEDKYDEDGE